MSQSDIWSEDYYDSLVSIEPVYRCLSCQKVISHEKFMNLGHCGAQECSKKREREQREAQARHVERTESSRCKAVAKHINATSNMSSASEPAPASGRPTCG